MVFDLVWPTTGSAMVYRFTDEIVGRPSKALRLAITVAGYGGIHIVAWKHKFPSATQSSVWRLSSICITIVGIYASFLTIFERLCLKALVGPENVDHSRHWYPIVKILMALHLVVFSMSCLIYAAASVSIYVLCFIDFAHLPPEAFTDIAWSKFIPHFS